jgi:hypothetical protein
MVKETITRIEDRIKATESLSPEKKQELLALVGELDKEIAGLAKTHRDDAGSVAGFAEASVHEATRDEINPELLQHSLDGLSLSVRSFEVSHPGLTGLINSIGQTLWKMGI